MRTAGIYARVSTMRQDLDVQLVELRQLASRRDWAIKGEYTDIITGATSKRPGLDRLLKDAHQRHFDLVLVWRLDRLGRSVVHMITVIDDLLSKGIDVVSATEPHMDSTTPAGRLLRNIFASVAEYEREMIRERVVAGLRHAQVHGTRSGKPVGRPRRVVDADEVRRRRSAGQSWGQISRALRCPTSTLRRTVRACQNPGGEFGQPDS